MPDKMAFLDRDMVAGLEKGLAVIEAFDEAHSRLSLTEVAVSTGLTRAAARRYLLTLTKLGYASYDGKFFSLTPRILRLGYAYLSSMALPARIQPFLERISEVTEESSSAAILDDTEVVYVARSAKRRIMSIGLGVGSRLPAYCSSLGRALLAYQDEAFLQDYFGKVALLRLTPKTKTSEADIRIALADVRARGYALVDEELEIGLRSFAVPVFDSRDRIMCAINVSTQAGRHTAKAMADRFLPVLAETRAALRGII